MKIANALKEFCGEARNYLLRAAFISNMTELASLVGIMCRMRALILTITAVGHLLGLSVNAADISQNDRRLELRVNARLPLGEAEYKERKYKTWRVYSDLNFYKRFVRRMEYIANNCPPMYSKAVRLVKAWHQAKGGSWTNGAGDVWLGCRDYNYCAWGYNDWYDYTIIHEIQHNVPNNRSENAARWTAIQYQKEMKFHPIMVRYVKGFAIGRHNYSQKLWDEKEK